MYDRMIAVGSVIRLSGAAQNSAGRALIAQGPFSGRAAPISHDAGRLLQPMGINGRFLLR